MPNDEQKPLPAESGAEQSPGSGGPRQSMSLREQVLEVINHVLADPCPEREWARAQLRELLVEYPDDPEHALLEHLFTTRKMTGDFGDEDLPPAGELPLGSSLSGEPRPLKVPFKKRSKKRIEAVLGNRMLLTAFQPIRELPDGKVAGLEALARFVSTDGTSADTWFREAAAIGLGPDLEIAALQCALSAARGVPPHLFVTFNVSPTTLVHKRAVELLTTSGLPLERMIVELSCRASDRILNDLIRALAPLRRNGLRVAVDGSGPGFTPAEHIRRLRPDVIKVDRTFIENVLDSCCPDDPAVIELAWEVGAVLAAEGIETEDELAAVMRTGMTVGQGYLLGRPSVHPLDWSAWVIQAETAASRVSPHS